jgi:hypothetical protein
LNGILRTVGDLSTGLIDFIRVVRDKERRWAVDHVPTLYSVSAGFSPQPHWYTITRRHNSSSKLPIICMDHRWTADF